MSKCHNDHVMFTSAWMAANFKTDACIVPLIIRVCYTDNYMLNQQWTQLILVAVMKCMYQENNTKISTNVRIMLLPIMVNTTTSYYFAKYTHGTACTYLCIQLYKYVVPMCICYMLCMYHCCYDSFKIKIFVVIIFLVMIAMNALEVDVLILIVFHYRRLHGI